VLVVVAGQGDLLEVVGALHAGGGLADLLHRRHQQADENGDDGDDHEEFDQRKTGPGPKRAHGNLLAGTNEGRRAAVKDPRVRGLTQGRTRVSPSQAQKPCNFRAKASSTVAPASGVRPVKSLSE